MKENGQKDNISGTTSNRGLAVCRRKLVSRALDTVVFEKIVCFVDYNFCKDKQAKNKFVKVATRIRFKNLN